MTAVRIGLCLLLAPCLAYAQATPTSAPDARKTVVAVAPFGSAFDDGRWGRAVTDAFYLKLTRWPTTTVIDKFSYADFAIAEKLQAAWDTPVAGLARFARETLNADIFIYGDVVGQPGGKPADVTLRVRAIDLRLPSKAGPTLAVDRKFEIAYATQLRPAVEIVLGQLVGYSSINMEVPALVKLTEAMEQRWRDGPNLVANPDFDDATGDGRLARWEAVIADKSYNPPRFDGQAAPLADDLLRHCVWGLDPANAKNRVLHMAVSENIAATHGVACYSDWIPITPGCIYRFSYRWRVSGPGGQPTPKVFIKGYADRPAEGEKEGGADLKSQRREVYRRQVHPTSDADPKRDLGNGWAETTADFCPRHDQAPPHWVRIDLYAYWPKGHAWFDHVVLKQLSDRPVVEQREPTTKPD